MRIVLTKKKSLFWVAVLVFGCGEAVAKFEMADGGNSNTEENTADACKDGSDNDGDGLVDCDDPDCAGVFVHCLDTETGGGPDGDTDSDTDSDSDSDTDIDADSDTDTDNDIDTDTDADSDLDADIDGDTDTDGDGDGDADLDTDTDTDTDSNPVNDSDTNTDTGTGADGDADTDGDSDTDTDIDTDADTDVDTDLDTSTFEEDEDYALRVRIAPEIDGVLDEEVWHLDTSANKRVGNSASDNSVLFDVLWDDDYLYIAIAVTDSRLCSGQSTQSFNYDSVEIYLDPNNNKTNTYEPDDIQMIFKYIDGGGYVEGSIGPGEIDFLMEGEETENGYAVEVAVPWSDLSISPTPDRFIGFDIGVNDDDADCGSRDGELRWNGTASNWESTAGFGNLMLLEHLVDPEPDTDTGTGTGTADTDTTTDELDTSFDPDVEIAHYTDQAPVIDGALDDDVWDIGRTADKIVSGSSDNSVLFDTLWDEEYLYVAVQVMDERICVGSDAARYNYDSVEVYLDPQNNGGETYDSLDVQMIFKYDDNPADYDHGSSTTNYAHADIFGRDIPGGYEIEVAIPWQEDGPHGLDIVPEIGRVIGFDIGVNDDDDQCGSRNGEIRWHGTELNFENTSDFGDLMLAEAIEQDTGTGYPPDTGTGEPQDTGTGTATDEPQDTGTGTGTATDEPQDTGTGTATDEPQDTGSGTSELDAGPPPDPRGNR